MNNKKRSAFTIVELVIVIAVIAILSAVLIPTFGAIIKDANVAADQTAAASLTTELHIHLKGNTIDSEEELVDALRESGVGEKLVPKALAYGYHFWFDMETQMFVANTAEEIVDARDPYEGSAASGMRNIYNNGYYLADSDSVIANMFGNMADITAATYASYFANVEAAKNDDNYGAIAEKVLENLKSTIIVNNNGIFFYTANTRALTNNSVWFAPGIKVVSADHYEYDGSEVKDATTLPGVVGGEFTLPSSVLLVEPEALDFGAGNAVVIKTNLANGNAIAGVFAPLSTDATIADKSGNTYKVAYEENPTDEHDEDRLVLASDGSWVADLIVRLPFADFEIGYETKNDLVEFNTDTLYVSYLESGKVVLFAQDTASSATSMGVHTWVSDNPAISVKGGVLSFDGDAIIAGSHRATITAYAKNLVGEDLVKTIKVEVRIVESATVKIGDYSYPLGQGDQHLSYVLDGNNQAITLVPTIGWKNVVGEDLYNLRAGEMKITKADGTESTDGNVTFAAGESEYSFTVSVDGRLETTFTVALIDLINAPFQTKFHHSNDYSPYYIGSGDEIKLSDLFYIADSDFDFEGATVTVYGFAEGGTDLYSVYKINNYRKNQGKLIWTDEDTITIASNGNWEDTTLRFRTDVGYSHTSSAVTNNYDVVIEIAPKNDLAMIAHVVIVGDAKNVNSVDTFNGTHNNSVILHNDLTMTTGKQATLNNGSTFYGNGYVITATGYQSSSTDANYLDSAVITMNGGAVENAYINGPTYAILDYTNNANKNYVSGIRTTGEVTITKSYIYGFRQPVLAEGTKLNVVDTTLEGGNMGNLLLETGNLYLKNVTTVQNMNGYQTTVGDSKKILGAGICIATSNITAKITIEGYLDQYNWIKNQTNNPSMPTVIENGKSFNLGELFGFIFNGVKYIGVTVDMGSVKYFINQDTTMTSNRTDGYVHAGVIYYSMGSESQMNTLAGQLAITINEDARTDGTIKMRKFDLCDMRFSAMGVKYGSIGFTGADYFDTDAIVKVWSHADNRQWSAENMLNLLRGHRYVNPSGGKVDSTKPIIQIGDNTDYKITYPGYNYGN